MTKAGFHIRREQDRYYWILTGVSGQKVARSWGDYGRHQTAARAAETAKKTMKLVI